MKVCQLTTTKVQPIQKSPFFTKTINDALTSLQSNLKTHPLNTYFRLFLPKKISLNFLNLFLFLSNVKWTTSIHLMLLTNKSYTNKSFWYKSLLDWCCLTNIGCSDKGCFSNKRGSNKSLNDSCCLINIVCTNEVCFNKGCYDKCCSNNVLQT